MTSVPERVDEVGQIIRDRSGGRSAMNAEETTAMVNELNPDLLFLTSKCREKTVFSC
jgi:hypothetical protein